MKKIILLFLLTVFAFSAAWICGDAGSDEDASGHHCLVCCDAGHYSYLLESEALPSPFLMASRAVIVQDTSYQDLFVSGIDRPPKIV
jgi:hypothetical protein